MALEVSLRGRPSSAASTCSSTVPFDPRSSPRPSKRCVHAEAGSAFARLVVAAFEKAERENSSAIKLDGFFVDYPIVNKAQRTLGAVRATEEVV